MKNLAFALVGAITGGLVWPALALEPLPPGTKTLVVFFDFDRARLTAEGERVVSDAAQAVRQDRYMQVTITGHADIVGTEPYNYKLSVRRAAVVRDELVRQGVLGRTIFFVGRGTHNPLVRTGRGVREPQNRRVVIDLGT